jgi:hypothetical protein
MSRKSSSFDDASGDAEAVFTREEILELSQLVDGFADLLKPPGKEIDRLTPARILTMNPTTTSNRAEYVAAREMERQGPLVLRGTFCRFLLASRLCGSVGSPYGYHDVVAAFDECAVLYGSFFGMPRSAMLDLLAKLLVPDCG